MSGGRSPVTVVPLRPTHAPPPVPAPAPAPGPTSAPVAKAPASPASSSSAASPASHPVGKGLKRRAEDVKVKVEAAVEAKEEGKEEVKARDPRIVGFDFSALESSSEDGDSGPSPVKKLKSKTKTAKAPTRASIMKAECEKYLDEEDHAVFIMKQSLQNWYEVVINYDPKARKRIDMLLCKLGTDCMKQALTQGTKSPYYLPLLRAVRAEILSSKICPETVAELKVAGMSADEAASLLQLKAMQTTKTSATPAEGKDNSRIKLRAITRIGIKGKYPEAYPESSTKGKGKTVPAEAQEEKTIVQKLQQSIASCTDPKRAEKYKQLLAKEMAKAAAEAAEAAAAAASAEAEPTPVDVGEELEPIALGPHPHPLLELGA